MIRQCGLAKAVGLLAGILFLFVMAADTGAGGSQEWVIFNPGDQADVPAGEPFSRWAGEMGWQSPLGDPRYFFVENGKLHMVSKPGPIYDSRFWLAVWDREKLKDQIENKVLVRISPEEFRIDPDEYPVIGFTMTPVTLPPPEADLRESDKNDAAFYLVVSFDTEKKDFGGFELPESIAYVWANRKWSQPVAGDPDYEAFMRYIPIGYGRDKLGQKLTVTRKIREDFQMAYPGRKTVPDIIGIALMIDSNTLGGTAESTLSRIWFESK